MLTASICMSGSQLGTVLLAWQNCQAKIIIACSRQAGLKREAMQDVDRKEKKEGVVVDFTGGLATTLREPLSSTVREAPLISNTMSMQIPAPEKVDASVVVDEFGGSLQSYDPLEVASAGPVEEATEETSRVSASEENKGLPQVAGNTGDADNNDDGSEYTGWVVWPACQAPSEVICVHTVCLENQKSLPWNKRSQWKGAAHNYIWKENGSGNFSPMLLHT